MWVEKRYPRLGEVSKTEGRKPPFQNVSHLRPLDEGRIGVEFVDRGVKKPQGELAHSLDPTDHQGGFSSGRNLQTEISLLARKECLSDMMVNSGVMENHS